MGSPGMVLGLLVQFWALQGASSLSVQQGPNSLQVRQGSQATLVCQVDQAPAWERLRVRWTKDGAILCQPYITNGSLSLGVCGPQGQLSWQAPSHLILKLDPVSLNHSGAYVCSTAIEIPVPPRELCSWRVQKPGTPHDIDFFSADDPTQNRNPTPSFPGLLFVLLGAGSVGVAIVLGAWFRGRRCCQQRDSGNSPGKGGWGGGGGGGNCSCLTKTHCICAPTQGKEGGGMKEKPGSYILYSCFSEIETKPLAWAT
nr:transmembrane and immunoglobulin domain-containing protein 2 [Macaca nemestrina]